MEFKVILAPRAIQDLRSIVAYVAVDRADTASRLGFALIDATKPLAYFPALGRIVPEFDSPTVRELILDPFRIVYRVDEPNRVVGIVRFWHGARGSLAPGDVPK